MSDDLFDGKPWFVTLKARACRWDGDKKFWHITVTGDVVFKDEIVWLKGNVYG